MRISLILLVIGVSLCAASSQRKKRSTLNTLAKREDVNLCNEKENGKIPPWMSVCDGGDTCIFTDWLCDGEPDCIDESDETRPDCADDAGADLCTQIDENGVVPFWMNVCEDQAKCIFQDWVCDSESDCFDGSDEENCNADGPIDLCDHKDTPGSKEWLKVCESGDECILVDWMCDKEADCKDQSDEQEEQCKDIWDNLEGGYRSGKKRR